MNSKSIFKKCATFSDFNDIIVAHHRLPLTMFSTSSKCTHKHNKFAPVIFRFEILCRVLMKMIVVCANSVFIVFDFSIDDSRNSMINVCVFVNDFSPEMHFPFKMHATKFVSFNWDEINENYRANKMMKKSGLNHMENMKYELTQRCSRKCITSVKMMNLFWRRFVWCYANES